VAVVRVRYYISKARFDGPERARVTISKKPIFLRPPQCILGYKYLKTAICPRELRFARSEPSNFTRSDRRDSIQPGICRRAFVFGPSDVIGLLLSDESTCRSRNSRMSQSYVSRCICATSEIPSRRTHGTCSRTHYVQQTRSVKGGSRWFAEARYEDWT